MQVLLPWPPRLSCSFHVTTKQHQTVHWHSKLNFFFSVIIRMTEFSTLAPQMASMPSLSTLSASSGFGKVKLVGGVGYWRHKIIVGLRTCNAVGQCLNSKSQLMCKIKSVLRLQTVSVQWFLIFVWNYLISWIHQQVCAVCEAFTWVLPENVSSFSSLLSLVKQIHIGLEIRNRDYEII